MGDTHALVSRELGVGSVERSLYSKVFTVTRNEVAEYVHEHGLPEGSVNSSPSLQDGNYLVQEGSRWCTYYQERGCRFNEMWHLSEGEATASALELLLYSSGDIL